MSLILFPSWHLLTLDWLTLPACEILPDVSSELPPPRWPGRTGPSGRRPRRREEPRTGWRSSYGDSHRRRRTPLSACPSWSRSSYPLGWGIIRRGWLNFISPTCSNPEQREESHPEGSEVCVFTQTLAGILLVTFWKESRGWNWNLFAD